MKTAAENKNRILRNIHRHKIAKAEVFEIGQLNNTLNLTVFRVEGQYAEMQEEQCLREVG